MAEIQEAVVQDEPKVAFMSKRYGRDLDKEEKELAELEASNSPKEETEEEKLEAVEPKGAEEKTWKKRHGDLRRHSQKEKDAFEERITKLEVQLSEASRESIKLPKTDEELEEWATEYPDVAKIVETIAMKKAKEISSSLDERMAILDKKSQASEQATAKAQLIELHPDFEEINDLDEFHEWSEEQPQWVQHALFENPDDPRSAARAIDLFKIDVGWGNDKKKAKRKSSEKQAAANISINNDKGDIIAEDNSGSFSESQINLMSQDEYESNEEAINAAIMSGKLIYDMSGAAR